MRLCNSHLDWLDGVLAPPNLLPVLNVQVKSVLTRTYGLEIIVDGSSPGTRCVQVDPEGVGMSHISAPPDSAL